MKKIIIVEDRPERQEQYIPDGKHGVEKLSATPGVFNCIGQDCKNHLDRLAQGDFTVLDGYDLIIYHRSALHKSGLVNDVNQYCQSTQVPLIHFTGGESSVIYSHSGFEYLLISSRLFYSSRLFDFIDSFRKNPTLPLIHFAYGDNWRLPYYLRLRNMLWQDQLEATPLLPDYQELCESIGKESISYAELTLEIRKMVELI